MERLTSLLLLILALILMSSSVVEARSQKHGRTRVDFDAMDIQGQTKRADAVYLFDRGKYDAKQLVKPRSDYRKEILESEF